VSAPVCPCDTLAEQNLMTFPPSEFDDWAGTYDASVAGEQFPFTGYSQVLEQTIALAQARQGLSVLDLGTGTGNLALPFALLGCDLWCTDFSEQMLGKARAKLPGAHFHLYDLRRGWPSSLPPRFDRIVSAYVFHHFELEEKIRLVRELVNEHLASAGRLVIADIAFRDSAALKTLKEQMGDGWEDEFYWVARDAIAAFEEAGLKTEYRQVSVCAGIFTFQA
jgi:putative AdoMet-dependent methyltransferase